jgi:hypothetical protein
LLEVRLNCADNLVAVAIEMHLADVIQRSVGLVTVAWAQLEEQCIADCWIGELQNLPLDLGLQCRAVSSGHCEIKTSRLEIVRAVLKGLSKDVILDLLHCVSTKVVRAMIPHEVVGPAVAISHGARRLRKLDIVLHVQGGVSWWIDAYQRAEVKGNLHPDKLDIGLTTVDENAINNWQQNCHVGGRGCVVNLIPRVVMKAQYRETAEIAPAVVEEAKPIVSDTVNRGGQVELLTQRVELNSKVDRH